MAQQEAAAAYAAALGLAFQIQDDILDVIGDAATLGKAVGMDEHKNTFVRLYGVDTCREMVAVETDKAIGALSHFENAEFLTELARSLCNREK